MGGRSELNDYIILLMVLLRNPGSTPQLRLVVDIPLFTMGFSTIPRWVSRRISNEPSTVRLTITLNDARPLVLPALQRYLQVRKEESSGLRNWKMYTEMLPQNSFFKLKLGENWVTFLRGTWVQKWSHQVSSWVVATQIFLEFSPRSLGKMNPIWRAYFSNGLVQPPTTYQFKKSKDFLLFFWLSLWIHPASLEKKYI